jgi:hypothetical protein
MSRRRARAFEVEVDVRGHHAQRRAILNDQLREVCEENYLSVETTRLVRATSHAVMSSHLDASKCELDIDVSCTQAAEALAAVQVGQALAAHLTRPLQFDDAWRLIILLCSRSSCFIIVVLFLVSFCLLNLCVFFFLCCFSGSCRIIHN